MSDKPVRGIFNPETGKIEYEPIEGEIKRNKPKRPPPQPTLKSVKAKPRDTSYHITKR